MTSPSKLGSILPRFRRQVVAVWGDVILDRYIAATTSRVSREAPVLVAEFESEEFRLGGAGNVVMNILTLGAEPIPVGLIGDDAEGRRLIDLLYGAGISTDFLVEVKSFRTPVKSRILSGSSNTRRQQVLRIDTLPHGDVPAPARGKLGEHLRRLAGRCSGLVISDYLGASVDPLLFNSFRSRHPDLPVLADSRERLADFALVTVATPNEPELRALFPALRFHREEDFHEAGGALLERLRAQGVVLKRGARGMLVFERDKKACALDIFGTDQIVDETGAGDTVLAVVGLGVASGSSLCDAARLANIAGGIVVMKEGAYPIHFQELRHACRQAPAPV